MKLVLTKEQEQRAKQGEIITTFDLLSMKKVSVVWRDNGFALFEKSSKAPIMKVVEFEGIANGVLRLGEQEQKQLDETGHVICYRSSSPKEKMSLQHQIDLGIARKIIVDKAKDGTITWNDNLTGETQFLKSDEVAVIQ